MGARQVLFGLADGVFLPQLVVGFFTIEFSTADDALFGLGGQADTQGRRMARDHAREAVAARLAADLAARIGEGGLLEAGIRALIYVRMADGEIDERGFTMLRRLAGERGAPGIGFARFKDLVREQFLMLHLHPERAIAELPRLLPEDVSRRRAMLELVRQVVTARGALSDETARRWARIEALFGGASDPARHILRSA